MEEIEDKRTDKKEYKIKCWLCNSSQLFTMTKFQYLDGRWAYGIACYQCKEPLWNFEDEIHEQREKLGAPQGMIEPKEQVKN